MPRAVLLIVLLALAGTVSAQSEVPVRNHPRQVFLLRNAGAGGDRLVFLDLLTGDQTELDAAGDDYTIVGGGVMYLDRTTNRVMLANPDGRSAEHPFVQLEGDARRIDWVIGGSKIAWTLTSGAPTALVTATWVANLDGSERRQVFTDGPRESIRAYPVAFDSAGTILYMDYQPDIIGDITPFRQYAGLFSVDLTSGDVTTLPGEPGCFCGAGIGAGRLVRLTLAANAAGFDVRLRDLERGSDRAVSGLNLPEYTQGGDVLIAPDGRYAAYALAQIRGLGTPQQTLRTVIAIVDLASGTQRTLTQPADRLLRPIQWTEDNSALLLVDPAQNVTLKASLSDGSLDVVANAVYIGTLENP